MREQGLRDHSNERGALDAGRNVINSAVWQHDHGNSTIVAMLDWLLDDSDWTPRYSIKPDPFAN